MWSAFISYSSNLGRRESTLIALVIGLVGAYLIAFAPPASFTRGTVVRIARGESVPAIVTELARAHVVAHSSALRFVLRIMGDGATVQPGAYLFSQPQDAIAVARRLASGDYGEPAVRLTFVEGITTREAAQEVANAFPDLSADSFFALAHQQEGYLFPDTYFFQPSDDVQSIIDTMHANFDAKIKNLGGDIAASGHSVSDIVIMASLVEKEARTSADRRVVAGILWNRIAHQMPLQVDAVFGYIFGRDTYSPSYADLQVDSPYNTYTHIGLPPGPIDNPGLDSLEAAIHPATTTALYYLSDKKGVLHTATTYAAHQANLKKYLQ